MAPTTNHLEAVVWADLIGKAARIVNREAAMGIPALARQRHLLCGVAARCPLVLVDEATGEREDNQPEWLTQGTGHLSAFHRTLWSTDDLVFYPFTVWDVERGPDGILWAERIAPHRWDLDGDLLLVDDKPASDDDTLVIPGPHEGVLSFGADALTRTLDNLEAAANAARNPSAYLELHYTGTEPQTPEQITQTIQRWAAARRGENAGVAWTGANLEVKEHGTHESHLLIEGRNADAVDVSRLVSSPAAMADATSAGASLTYETTSGRNLQFLDYGALLYMDAMAARLSMDDVSPRGKGVRFDVTRLLTTTPDTTPDNAQE
jgi:hypothetical protein